MDQAEPRRLAAPGEVVQELMASIGLRPGDSGGAATIVGDDPVVDSRHRLGVAAAAVLATQGAAIATIWRMRSGQGQDVSVEARRAAAVGLRTADSVRQNGYAHESWPRATYGAQFFRTKDARQMFILRATPYMKNLLDVLELLNCSYAPDSMSAAVAQWDAQALEDAMAERKLLGVIARHKDEWRAHPQGRWLAAKPVVEIEKIGDSAPEPLPAAPRPLAGIRVLDFTHVLAGPASTRVLAEQGADVLHLSAPHQLDPIRLAIDTGLGKRSAFLDIDQPEEAKRLTALARDADIFVQSWRPRSLDHRGFSAEALARLRPGMIYVSVSCYGDGGPWATRGGYESFGQTASGLVIDEGSEDAPRRAVVGTLNDYLTAYLAAAGALGALIKRARDGGSYHVKVALTRTSMWIQDLGQLPREEWPHVAPSLEPLPSDLMQMQSPFGQITVPGPITQYSRTPGYWDRPPEPFGASLPAWLSR